MGKAKDAELTEHDAWHWLQQQHPAICTWLEPFSEKGRKRGDKGEFWWELRACAYYEVFPQVKIVYVDIGSNPTFVYDSQGSYCANTAYFVPKGEQFLTGLLNSNVFWYLITGKSNAIRGGFYRLFTQHMETIPIPKATYKQKQHIAQLAESCQTIAEDRYQTQDRIRRRIPSLCTPDKEAKLSNKLKAWWELDFTEFQKEIKSRFKHKMTLDECDEWEGYLATNQQKVQQWDFQLASKEAELNKAVYDLFGLDDEEISLLENNLK